MTLRSLFKSLGFVLVTAVLGGCVSVPRDAGFGEVQRMVRQQTNQSIEWNRGMIETPLTDERLRDMLQGEIDADRAVEIALMNNRDLQATLEELGIARAEYLQAFLPRNPILDAEIRLPGRPKRPYEIAIMQTLIDLLQLRTRRQLGEALFLAARMRVTAAVLNFAAEARSDFYDLQAAEQVLARQRTIGGAARVSAELSTRQHQSGNISDLDLENEQAVYEQMKLSLARAELDALTARERVISDMGLVGTERNWKVAPQFPVIPPSEARAVDLETVALDRRADLAVARQELEAARRTVPIARWAPLEELAVGVHREREPEGKITAGPAVSIPIPIFNRGAARQRAYAALRQAEQRYAALNVNARSEVRAARQHLLEARARAQYLRDVILPRRNRILYLTQLEYNAMLRGVYQLIQARQDLASAEVEYVLAQRDYWMARTAMETAMSGVGGFSARQENPRVPRPKLFSPMNQQQSKAKE